MVTLENHATASTRRTFRQKEALMDMLDRRRVIGPTGLRRRAFLSEQITANVFTLSYPLALKLELEDAALLEYGLIWKSLVVVTKHFCGARIASNFSWR